MDFPWLVIPSFFNNVPYWINIPNIGFSKYLLGRKTARQLGDAAVGELDTAFIATAYCIRHTLLLLLLFEIMVQQMMLNEDRATYCC